jgi:hypothetical protein
MTRVGVKIRVRLRVSVRMGGNRKNILIGWAKKISL